MLMVPHNPRKEVEATGGTNMLDVGESALAPIEAKEKWNDTGIELVSGHEYRFTTSPS